MSKKLVFNPVSGKFDFVNKDGNVDQSNIAHETITHDGTSQVYTITEFDSIFQVFVNNGHLSKNVDFETIGNNQIDFLGNLEPTDTIIDIYYVVDNALAAPYYTQVENNNLLDNKVDKEDSDGKFLVTNLGGDPSYDDVRNNGLTVFSFEVTNDIVISNNEEFNLFNSTNGMLSNNGVLTVSGDSWDRMIPFDGEYIKPDAYLHTKEPYQPIETDIFIRIPTDINGTVTRGVILEIRRRTAASPTIPLSIPQREVELLVNNNVETTTLQRLPTRSEGVNDNYNVFGYAPFIVNLSGGNITIPATKTIRIEYDNTYKKPVSFNTLNSPNL